MATTLKTNGGIVGGSGSVVSVVAATVTLAPDAHAGRIVALNRAAGIAVTLPAATGTGDTYNLFVGTTVTSNSTTITAAGSDTYVGQIETATTTGATTNGFCEAAGTTDHIVTMNGTTTGGIVGSWLRFRDVASAVWLVEGGLVGSGTLATSIS